MNPLLTKNFTAEGAITKHRIVKFGTADGSVIQAAAVGDAMFGVNAELDVVADERVDIHVVGLVDVEYGGVVTRGDLLTANASGQAVAAAPGAGVNSRIIGIALLSGVAGDVVGIQLAPGRIQG